LGFYPLFWEIATTTESSYSKQAQELKKHGITGIHNRKLSASAICQARQKIKASAFDEASQTVIDCAGNDQDNFLYWNGFQIIGGDATSAWLDNPQYQAIIDSLNTKDHARLRKSPTIYDAKHKQFHMVTLYDTLNKLTLTSNYALKNIGERELIAPLIGSIPDDSILVLDRGYKANWLYYALIKMKKKFCVRISIEANCNWQKDFIASGEVETFREFYIEKKYFSNLNKIGIRPRKRCKVKLRVVRVDLNDGEVELLVSNLLPSEVKTEQFKSLYHQRWPVEGSYDLLKNTLKLESWNARSKSGLEQEIAAKIFAANLNSYMASSIRKEFHGKSYTAHQEKNTKKSWNKNCPYRYSINMTECIREVKGALPSLMLAKWNQYATSPPLPSRKNLRDFVKELQYELWRSRNWIRLDIETDNERRFKTDRRGKPPGANRKIS
jgi:hypothetical protein